ncbi:MAG: cation transporter [Candidatus Eisenbacteria bacterium]|nr:cation transporter [Candidatus Eisenbacteria bacterium]
MFKTKTSAAALSVTSNAFLVAAKVVVGLMTGSISVLSEAAHSGVDLIAAVIAWVSVRVSSRPPDEGHPFGHGKFESVSATVEAALIFVVAVLIFNEAVRDLVRGPEMRSSDVGLVVMAVSAIVNVFVSRLLYRVAAATDSVALEADAKHLSADVYTSLGVFAGLAAVKVTGLTVLDPVVAILVGALIVRTAYCLTARTLKELLDAGLPEQEKRKVELILSEHRGEFVGFHKLRCRKSGGTRHIDMHLVVCRDKTVGEAHDLCDRLESDIKSAIRSVSLTIHVEPCKIESDRCQEECPEKRA